MSASIWVKMTEKPAENSRLQSRRSSALPAILSHSDLDTPVPTWKQVTRSVNSTNSLMILHLTRVVSGTESESLAVGIWDAWSGPQKRSVALLVDKIYHEGWLDSVGPIVSGPWDGGFFFWPANFPALVDVLDAKSRGDGVYVSCSFRGGLTGYLSGWNHPGWQRGWIENDTPFAALHVGVFGNGSAEVHLDLFNPLHTRGAPRSNILTFWGLGSYNRRLFRLHRKWEGKQYGAMTRTSANLYHLMQGRVPLCF